MPRDGLVLAAVALCFAALAGRVVAPEGTVVVLLIGVSALLLPGASERRPMRTGLAVCLAGCAAFGVATLLAPAPAVPRWWWGAATAASIGVAEEAFFRRTLWARLARHGTAVAVLGTAVAFAVVHVHAYGPGVLPVDLAAGLLFGWQRWASGTWTVPAATHAFANLGVMW